MRARILGIFLSGIAAWAAIGCGDTESDGAGDKEQFLAAVCRELAPCCEAVGRPTDGAQCRAFYSAFLSSATYDQAAADTCLEEFRARQDVCETRSKQSPSCAKVFKQTGGTKQPGETCDSDSDCASPAEGEVECVSDYSEGSTVQKCQVRLPGKLGSSPCVGTVDGNVTYFSGSGDGIPSTGYLCDKADALSCDGQTGACTALVMVGEPCTDECVPSAYCDLATGVCKERLAIGAACRSDGDCVETAFCDPGSSLCVALRATGAACESSFECESKNCTNQTCGSGGLTDLSLTLLCGTK